MSKKNIELNAINTEPKTKSQTSDFLRAKKEMK